MHNQAVIINAALTGVVPTKADNPSVPVTPEEIAADAKRVCRLGASILHLHARDHDGKPTTDVSVFREIVSRIREFDDQVIITVTTSGRRAKNLAERMAALDLDGALRPDMGSLSLGSMNFIREPSVNPPADIQELARAMRERGILPELEIFEAGMANYAAYLRRKELLPAANYANLLLGSLGTMPATAANLVHLVRELPEGTTWAATGIGAFAFQVQRMALAMGGHVRVGLEDGVYMDPEKKHPATNESLVARVVRLAEAMERPVATPAQVRAHLGLPERAGASVPESNREPASASASTTLHLVELEKPAAPVATPERLNVSRRAFPRSATHLP